MVIAIFDGTTMGIRDSTSTKSMHYRPQIGKTVYLLQESAELGLNWPSWTARAKRKAVGAVGLIPRGDINTQNQAQVGDQVDMVAIEGRPRLCGL